VADFGPYLAQHRGDPTALCWVDDQVKGGAAKPHVAPARPCNVEQCVHRDTGEAHAELGPGGDAVDVAVAGGFG
jgi:hypothetical protein